MFDRNGKLIRYATEQEMLNVLKGDRMKPNLKPVWHTTMLVDAVSWGWNTAIKHMIEEMDFSPHEHDHKNYTPLGYAAMKGHYGTAVMLVDEYDCDIDARNKWRMLMERENYLPKRVSSARFAILHLFTVGR